MDIFTVIAGSILSIAMAYLAIKLVFSIYTNVIIGMRFRRSLAHKLHQLRLSRMLNALGIDINKYLHDHRVIDIQQHMTKCAACENTGTCDDELDTGTINPDNLAYCSNERDLQEMVGKVQAANAARD